MPSPPLPPAPFRGRLGRQAREWRAGGASGGAGRAGTPLGAETVASAESVNSLRFVAQFGRLQALIVASAMLTVPPEFTSGVAKVTSSRSAATVPKEKLLPIAVPVVVIAENCSAPEPEVTLSNTPPNWRVMPATIAVTPSDVSATVPN